MPSVNIEELLKQLELMARIRYFEEEVLARHTAGDIVGSVHLCNGQEAIYVGSVQALNLPVDKVFSTYRGHGWAIACGVPIERLFAELMGRESGINGGRGGSAYFTAPWYGFMGENSIVGAHAPIATGAALAAAFDGSDRVVLCALGEGAMNQGSVHEALNFASIRSAPVIFLVENNGYSELTPTSEMVRIDRLYRRGSGYGISAVRIDGNNPDTMRKTIAAAAEQARAGGGPALVEATTQRIVGHYIGDAQQYRPAGEVDNALADEPIARALEALGACGVLSDELDRLLAQVREDVSNAAVAAASDSPADPSSVMEHLYAI